MIALVRRAWRGASPPQRHARGALLACLALLALVALAACRRGGGEGAPCAKPADCRYGFRCEEQHCLGGAESACGYLLRCLPLLRPEDRETLFGENHRQWLDALTHGPQQEACAARLALIVQMGRLVVLHRACGPRIEH